MKLYKLLNESDYVISCDQSGTYYASRTGSEEIYRIDVPDYTLQCTAILLMLRNGHIELPDAE
jgi:hypothetical protein